MEVDVYVHFLFLFLPLMDQNLKHKPLKKLQKGVHRPMVAGNGLTNISSSGYAGLLKLTIVENHRSVDDAMLHLHACKREFYYI